MVATPPLMSIETKGAGEPTDLRASIRAGAPPVIEIRGEIDIQSAPGCGTNCSG